MDDIRTSQKWSYLNQHCVAGSRIINASSSIVSGKIWTVQTLCIHSSPFRVQKFTQHHFPYVEPMKTAPPVDRRDKRYYLWKGLFFFFNSHTSQKHLKGLTVPRGRTLLAHRLHVWHPCYKTSWFDRRSLLAVGRDLNTAALLPPARTSKWRRHDKMAAVLSQMF